MNGLRWLVVFGVVAVSVGCGRVDEKKVYTIARDHVMQQVGEEAEVTTRKASRLAVNKNMARVDIDYRRGGSAPVEGYMTVWCKRVRMRWEFERATDSRSLGGE
ncbi:MAG: hypothetical protein HN919_17770 [Verrucomicrobia bacterium]|jgi:hypothetical protein|nr:hypothetical protein [Verrucomicrobiota bacterium]MBT7068148.1 hypothetical protein [Verrucomicrobiota bacterium]MBT7699066.1 hypothetical protein [Verrucomicrobiota bacterium]